MALAGAGCHPACSGMAHRAWTAAACVCVCVTQFVSWKNRAVHARICHCRQLWPSGVAGVRGLPGCFVRKLQRMAFLLQNACGEQTADDEAVLPLAPQAGWEGLVPLAGPGC